MLKTAVLTPPFRMPPGPRLVKENPSPVFLINFARCDFVSCTFKRSLAGILFVYLAVNLLVGAFLLSSAVRLHARYQTLAGSIRADLPREMDIDQLYVQMDELHLKVASRLQWLNDANRLEGERFPAAEKLEALGGSLPERTWFTKIQGSASQRTLTIEALYYIAPDEPFQLPVTPWMETLKQNASFGRGLHHLELTKSSQDLQGRAELQKFELSAEWKPGSDV